MKMLFFVGWVLLAQNQSQAQMAPTEMQTPDPRLITGTADTLYSTILNEKRTIWVSLPASTHDKRLAPQRYPVVYLLDGDNHFATATAMIHQLTADNGNFIWPEMIVVGIINTHRDRDFTPWPSDWWIFGPPTPLENTGGGEDFVRFLQTELIPHIDSLYPTAPYRILIGHSLAGLATTNILIRHTALFNGYIIVDPSMWYDNGRFLRLVKDSLQKKRFANTGLYLGIAHSMGPNQDTFTARRDTAAGSIHIRRILQLQDILHANQQNGLRFTSRYYPHDSHMSAPLITIYDGLRFLFNFYPLQPGMDVDMLDPRKSLDPAQLFQTHFKKVSARMGYPFPPPENLVDLFINTCIDYHLPDRALRLGYLNLLNYPDSPGSIQLRELLKKMMPSP
jgi:predicted alpha/beta superfamily hydrolase